jgi:hypothetical protein
MGLRVALATKTVVAGVLVAMLAATALGCAVAMVGARKLAVTAFKGTNCESPVSRLWEKFVRLGSAA